jgi:hypothetical protein
MATQVKSWIRRQLEKRRLFKGWFIERDFRRNMKKLDAEYDPLIAKAKADKDFDEVLGLQHSYSEQWEDISEPSYDWESAELRRRAHKHLVNIPDYNEEPAFWQETKYSNPPDHPDYEMSYKGKEKLKRNVRDAERAANDEYRKWATLLFALAATGLSVWSLLIKTKQDSCQKNYYRNDAGACVFALKAEKTIEVPAFSPVVIPPTIPQTAPPVQVPPAASTTPPSSSPASPAK